MSIEKANTTSLKSNIIAVLKGDGCLRLAALITLSQLVYPKTSKSMPFIVINSNLIKQDIF